MKRWIIALIPLLVLGWLINGRLQEKRAEALMASEQRQARRQTAAVVLLAPVQVRDIIRSFEGVGNVEAPLSVKVSSQITGRITYVQGREGDPVHQGQVLVRIDPSELRAQVAQRRAAVAEAKHRLAQAAENEAPTEVSVTADIRQQEAALASAQARAAQAEQHLDAEVAAAKAAVTEAEGRVESAMASMANADAAIRSAQANLDNARAAFKRVNDLYQQGYVAAQDVDNARTQVSVQEAALDAARGQLKAAIAARDSAIAQKQAAEKRVEITRTRCTADVQAARAQVSQARAALEFARANTARKPAYQRNLSALQAAVDAAQASLENAEAMLAHTVITSPIDGFVTARTLDPGAVATPGQQILAVQAMQQVWVTVSVPEDVHRQVRKGNTATVRFDALPGQSFTGKVTQINAAADPVSRQFAIRITLDNRDNLLKPGMFARVTLVTERVPNAVVVPPEAVQTGKNGPFVVVVDAENIARHRPVVTGASDNQGLEIREGLQPGERIVVMTARPLKDGQAVRPAGEGSKQGAGKRPDEERGAPRQSGSGQGPASAAGPGSGGQRPE